jgi:hypothetical protein
MRDDTCPELKRSRESLLRAWEALQKLRKIIEVFVREPVRRPSARSFSEKEEILSESLVRILTGLNRDLQGLLRATAAMRPYFGGSTKDGKFPHLLIQLNKALDVQVRSAGQVRAVISQVRHRDF